MAKDDFFRDEIAKGKDGYIDLALVLKCNKVKKLGVNKAAQVVKACKDSTEVEFSKDGLKVRRTGNKALPGKTGTTKKREVKALSKNASKVSEKEETKTENVEDNTPLERDEKGRLIFCQNDFENTLIVHFKTTDVNEKEDENYKVSWKDLEKHINDNYDQIKVVYSRGDKYEGDMAISSHKLCKAQYAKLSVLKNVTIGTKKFTFTETKGTELEDFWQK